MHHSPDIAAIHAELAQQAQFLRQELGYQTDQPGHLRQLMIENQQLVREIDRTLRGAGDELGLVGWVNVIRRSWLALVALLGMASGYVVNDVVDVLERRALAPDESRWRSTMHVRDRIQELRRVPARELRPHPLNWRTHPARQQDALRGVLAEIGYADALLVRELDDGSLQLVDGHLRAETTPDAIVPVLVLDVSADEAKQILLTHDPLSALAGTDEERLAELLASTEFESDAVAAMLAEVANAATGAESLLDDVRDRPEVQITQSFQVVVHCDDEDDQRELFERMRAEGYSCRVLTLS